MKKTERALRGLRRVLKPQAVTIRILLSYISILLLLFSVLAISRYYLKQNGDPLHGFWVSVIDNLSAGVIVTAFAAIFFYIVSPQISVEEELSVIDAWNINPSLRAPLETKKITTIEVGLAAGLDLKLCLKLLRRRAETAHVVPLI